jgi:hypothetical protein
MFDLEVHPTHVHIIRRGIFRVERIVIMAAADLDREFDPFEVSV